MKDNYKNEQVATGGDSSALLSFNVEGRENRIHDKLFFDKVHEWLTASEAAVYLRKFRADRSPSKNAIYMMVYRGALKRRKFHGRLYFSRFELDRAIERGDSF